MRTVDADFLLSTLSNQILFGFDHLEAISTALAARTDPEEDYSFHVKLASVFAPLPSFLTREFVPALTPPSPTALFQFLSLLGQKHLQFADTKIPPNYDKYASSGPALFVCLSPPQR
jgi:hypothetical protein